MMCGKIDVQFDPETYNDDLEEMPTWCDFLRGTVMVYGADHLRELYVNIEYDYGDEGSETPLDSYYDIPKLRYYFQKENWESLRWPSVLDGWTWDDYPEVPFKSWTSSCVFDIGTYDIKNFSLAPFVDEDAGSVEIANNQFPGIVYNIAELCDGGNCEPLQAKHRIAETNHPDIKVELDHREWAWSAHSFATGYRYYLDHLLNGTVIATNDSYMLKLYDPEQIKYCTGFAKLGPHSMRTVGGGYTYLSDMPDNVFWSHVIEYKEDVSYVTETYAGAWCFDPWDDQDAPDGTAATQGNSATLPPWERGVSPRWTTIDKLILPSTAGYNLEVTEPNGTRNGE